MGLSRHKNYSDLEEALSKAELLTGLGQQVRIVEFSEEDTETIWQHSSF
jgi:hypothetical protein